MGSTWSWPWSPSNSITSKNKNVPKSEAMLQFEQQVEMMDAVFKRYFQRLSFSFLFLEQLNYVLENAYLQDQTENLTS